LLEEIKYWKPEFILHYIEERIVPLRVLAEGASKGFRNLDPRLSFYAKKISELASNIIDKAETIYSTRLPAYEAREPSDIYELIELGREFLEKAFNLTIGAEPRTFFIWSLRKITKIYLKEHYPKLKDQEVFNSIARILGLEVLLEPPKMEPEELFEDYTLYGYPDFATELQVKQKTLGGLVCELNETIWELSRDDEIRSYDTLYERPKLREYGQYSLYSDYIMRARDLLDSIGWDSRTLPQLPSELEFRIRDLIVEVNIPTGWRGAGQVRIPIATHHDRMTLFNFLDIAMPPQMLGLWELYIKPNKRSGRIVSRKPI